MNHVHGAQPQEQIDVRPTHPHCSYGARDIIRWFFRARTRVGLSEDLSVHATEVKRRVEVPMRNLTREDRDALTEARRQAWVSWLDKDVVVSKCREVTCSVRAGCFFGKELTTKSSESPTVRADIVADVDVKRRGFDSAIACDLRTPHATQSLENLISEKRSSHRSSGASFFDPPADLKSWLYRDPGRRSNVWTEKTHLCDGINVSAGLCMKLDSFLYRWIRASGFYLLLCL